MVKKKIFLETLTLVDSYRKKCRIDRERWKNSVTGRSLPFSQNLRVLMPTQRFHLTQWLGRHSRHEDYDLKVRVTLRLTGSRAYR